MQRRFILLCATALLSACATTGVKNAPPIATANLTGPDGSSRGTARITASGNVLTLELDGVALSPGTHGAHLHAVGRCDPPAFASAGPHLNPGSKQHGSMNPQGKHLGDLPNLTIDADGTGTFSVPLDGTPSAIEAALFDADGTAIVVHATADDYLTDPSGNSGSRIACGVLVRTR